MNFLLYMLGRAQRAAGVRPTPRQLLLSAAATHATKGRMAEALSAYGRLGGAANVTPLDLLVRGHLHLTLEHYRAAQRCFMRGSERLLSRRTTPRETEHPSPSGDRGSGRNFIEQLLSHAAGYLRRGRFVRAAELLEQARAILDVLLSAHAGLAIAEAHGDDAGAHPGIGQVESAMVHLARLSDLCLRLLARTHLATHVSEALRERRLREDLASWAITAPCVNGLLEAECDRLSVAAVLEPDHAELHYRLGLVARAAHRLDIAAGAFRQTLRIHPHHVASAARLAATLRQLQTPADDLAILRKALDVRPETLRQFAAFADIAGHPAAFDRAADLICIGQPDPKARMAARSNLAFALSELTLLDPARAAWREPAAV